MYSKNESTQLILVLTNPELQNLLNSIISDVKLIKEKILIEMDKLNLESLYMRKSLELGINYNKDKNKIEELLKNSQQYQLCELNERIDGTLEKLLNNLIEQKQYNKQYADLLGTDVSIVKDSIKIMVDNDANIELKKLKLISSDQQLSSTITKTNNYLTSKNPNGFLYQKPEFSKDTIIEDYFNRI